MDKPASWTLLRYNERFLSPHCQGRHGAGPDLLGLYLDEAGSFPLLTKADEMRLGQVIQAAQAAQEQLDTTHGLTPRQKRDLRKEIMAGEDATTRSSIPTSGSWSLSPVSTSGRACLSPTSSRRATSASSTPSRSSTGARASSSPRTPPGGVRQSIGRAIENTAHTVRIPAHVGDEIPPRPPGPGRARSQERPPAHPGRTGRALEIDESMLAELLHYDSDPVSLDAAVGEDGDTSLGDLVVNHSAQSPFELVAQALLAGQINEFLSRLSDDERRVLSLRYGLDRGEPRRRRSRRAARPHGRACRRIERDALTKLRRALAGSDARDLLAS